MEPEKYTGRPVSTIWKWISLAPALGRYGENLENRYF